MQHSAVASAMVARLDRIDAVAEATATDEDVSAGVPAAVSVRLVQTFSEDGFEALGELLHDDIAERVTGSVVTSVEYPDRFDASGRTRPDYNRPELVIRFRERTDGAVPSAKRSGYIVKETP